jgi:hypothetical protein
VFGAISFFFGFTERLTDRYPDLFSGGNEEDQGSKSISSTAGFERKWSGYNTIAILSNQDITKFDTITELPVHKCLTYLSYLKDHNEVQLQAAKQYQTLK